jgi:4-alpha-glucanotransferase
MKKHELLNSNHTGLLLPLFSMNSNDDFGIGDISSLMEWLEVLREMKFDLLQILPINEMPPQTNCPYTSMTAFAIDPIYISIKNIENLSSAIKEEINSKEFKDKIKAIKKKDYIDYDEIKKIKFELLWKQYNYFQKEFDDNHPFKNGFKKYIEENDYWLDSYAIFRRLKDIKQWTSWTTWEEPLKNRDKNYIENFKKNNQYEINFFKYIQWEIEKQWKKAREKAIESKIKFFGDLPFMVNQESADVWARQEDFRIDLEAGAPPDAFSETGQKWGLPAYNWPNVEKNNFEWWRMKVKKFSEFYDIFRIDHMVGFFRTWVIPKNPDLKPNFDVLDPLAQENRGRNFLKAVISASPMLPIAEDLGVIPKFVYKVLKELHVCGYKVLRWEKNEDNTYKDPKDYDEISLATTATHDHEPMALWWEIAEKKEKDLFWRMIANEEKAPHSYKNAKDKVIEKAFTARSRFLLFPMQDLIGSKERINEPNTVGVHNWTYRLKDNPDKFRNKHAELIEFLNKKRRL